MATEMAERGGTFSVELQAITRAPANISDAEEGDQPQQHEKTLWALVQVEQLNGRLLDGVWFGGDDDNVMTKSVQLSSESDCNSAHLEYIQSSRAVQLTKESLVSLLNANLKVSVYSGDTRSRATDELLGETRVPFLPVVVSGKLRDKVCVTSASGDVVTVEVTAQCDVALADFALGARVLSLHSVEITDLPKEWTFPSCESDDEAVKFCAAADRNTATYEMELQLPEFGLQSSEKNKETVKFSSGKLKYEPGGATNSVDSSNADPAPTTPTGLTGVWSVAFPRSVVNKLYLKSTINRLVEFLEVEKSVPALLRRSSVEAAGRVSATSTLNLSGLASPGQLLAHAHAPIRKIVPLPKEALEQELTSASTNDEKKRLQALINDYDAAFVQTAAALSGAVRAAKTRIGCVLQIVGDLPLVLEPPPEVAPAKPIEELIAPRDLSDEYDQRKDVSKDLRTEIRRVVLTVLREYEDAEVTNSRDEKRQRIVFKLNSQGAYHEFKEKLKKRIVPMIRDWFAEEMAMNGNQASTMGEEDDLGEQPRPEDGGDPFLKRPPLQSHGNAKKKVYFTKLYAALMEEVQRVLHETFYASTASQLEKTHRDLQPRDDAKITQTLMALGLKALENEMNGDVEKCEAFHLDRIAFAEERAIELPLAASTLRPSLCSVWLDYARFCLGQSELDKAGGALRQCLSLEPHAIEPLVTYSALLCELQDFTSAEFIIKNTVHEARQQAEHGDESESALRHVVTAHAILACFFAQSGRDTTGNLVLFELLKAQKVLRRLADTATINSTSSRSSSSLSSVWIHLADQSHQLKLRTMTQMALQLADQYLKSRDMLTQEERVLQRTILAEVLSARGEGDRATVLLQEALELDRFHAFTWLVLGKTYLQLENQSQMAIDCLQRSLDSKPRLRVDQRLSLHIHLGLILLQSAQFALAKTVFLSGCQEFPTASMWLGVGIASFRLEDWDGAQIAFAEANRLDTTNPEIWGYLALLALTCSPRVTAEYEQRARQSVTQALRHQLRNPVLLRELSSAFVAIDRLEDAERLLRRSLAVHDSSLTRKTLADVLAAQNCAEDALAQYKQSLDESTAMSQRCELLEKCAALLVTLGRPDEATEYRRMASQLQAPDISQDRVVTTPASGEDWNNNNTISNQ